MELERHVTRLIKHLTSSQINKDAFISSNTIELYILNDVLTHLRQFNSNIYEKLQAQTLHERLFRNCLGITNIEQRLKDLPYMLATKFCKGITLFKERGEVSSSTGASYSRNEFIQALIYDHIYFNTFNSRDISALKELNDKRIEFESHNKQKEIFVIINIGYEERIYPVRLEVVSRFAGNDSTKRETYSKSEYNSTIVYCTQQFANKHFEKVQTYYMETAWAPCTTKFLPK